MYTYCHQTAEVPSSNAIKKVAFLRGLAKLKASPLPLSCQVYKYYRNFKTTCTFGIPTKQSLFCRPSPRCGVPHEDHKDWHKALLQHVAHFQSFIVHIVVCLLGSYVLWITDAPFSRREKRSSSQQALVAPAKICRCGCSRSTTTCTTVLHWVKETANSW